MSAITVGGDLVHYEVLGRGRPVILIHGWLGSWRYWIPAMRQLQLKYRVYAVDLFGFGDSGKNPDKYSISQQVVLLDDFMRALAIPKAAMIGHGLGAQVIMQFASQNQEKVARMMITGAPLFDPGDLATRPMPGRRIPLTSSNDPNPLATTRKMIEAAEKAAANEPFSSHNAETVLRRPKEMDALLTAKSTADPTVPSSGNQTVTDPSKMIDRDRLREAALEAALARGEAAVAREESRSVMPSKEVAFNPLRDALAGYSVDALLAKCFRRSEAEYEKLQADTAKMDDVVLRRATLNFDAGKLLETMRMLTMPLVILHGMDDQLIQSPTDEVWQYLTQERENLVLPIPLPGVRHFPMLEYEPFMRLVNDFLEVPEISKIEVKERWRRRTR